MPNKGFQGLRVLALESRRAQEMAKLIASYDGKPTVAPAMREVPLESNKEAAEFVAGLISGGFDAVIFLTGVGTRALVNLAERAGSRDQFVDALRRVKVVARGPKPIAVLRDLAVPVTLSAPEPNTWRELLRALDENAPSVPLKGQRVAVQEYGVSTPELLEGLSQRGALVVRVPVYQWALPEDTEPLRHAVAVVVRGELDVALFTTSVQVTHLFQMAGEVNQRDALRQGLQRMVIASIGPATSEELRQHGLEPDFEPSHPKMGFLVKEAAERSAELLQRKQAR